MSSSKLEKDLTREFNKLKIVLNPLEYNLKDRVLLTDSYDHCDYQNTTIISEIFELISEKFNKTTTLIDFIEDIPCRGINARDISSGTSRYGDYPMRLGINNNLYFVSKRLASDTFEDFSLYSSKILLPDKKSQDILDTVGKFYIPMCVLMQLDTSLIDVIRFIPLNIEKDNVNALKNLARLEDELNRYKTSSASEMDMEVHSLSHNVFNSLRYSQCKDDTCYNYLDKGSNSLHLVKSSYLMSLVTAAELFANLYQSVLEPLEKEKLKMYILRTTLKDKFKDLVVDRFFYDYNKDCFRNDVQQIIECTDLNERYKLLKEYMNFLDTVITLDDANKHFEEQEYLPMPLSTLTQTALEYSYRNYLVKFILMLINFCKANDINLSKLANEDIADLGSFGLGLAGMSNIEDNSIVNLDTTKYTGDASKLPMDYESDKKAKKDSVSKIRQTSDLLDKALNFSESKYDFEVSFVRSKPKDVSDSVKEGYEKIVNATKLINKLLIKHIKEIKTYNKGAKNPGLTKGKLDPKRMYMYRDTQEIFYNNTYKIKESDLAIGLCLDASGSMRGEGIENGIATMIVMHETLKALGINHCITTHTSHCNHNVIINKYQPFKEDRNYTIDKCYDLVNIKARSGNCDSGALYYMEKELSRVHNKDKICIMFSDGEPTECSETELIDQVNHMEKVGIRVIGVGIDYDSIKKYYPHYANGRNLKEMLDIVSDILREYVLEKVE